MSAGLRRNLEDGMLFSGDPAWNGQVVFLENGLKFETLAVDLISFMGSVLPCEVRREKEFAPVKNATGADSVETARALLELNGVTL